MTMPTWLQRHLETTGQIDARTVSTRRAQPRPCPRCRATTLVGDDNHTIARPCRVDMRPLTARGEAQALLAGRYTCHLLMRGGRLELTGRDHWQITGKPAGQPGNRFDVLAQHVCDAPQLDGCPSYYARRFQPAAPGQEPPF